MIRRTVAVAAASLVVALAAGAPATAAPGTPQAEGADLVALSVESGKLRMSFRSESRAVTDPQSLRFTASGSPVGVIPNDPAFAFLGRPGAPVWSLQDGSPFSTFDTTAITADDVAGGAVTLDLLTVDGPGSFAAYTLSEWGRPTLLLDSDGRTSARLPAGKRLGGVVWLFDATGEYRVTLRATARTGSRTLKDEAVYAVSVPARPLAAPQAAPAPRIPAPARAAAPNRTTAAAAASTPATGRRVIADGHVDMGPQLSGGALRIRLKDDTTTPATWRELSDVTLKVTDKARIDVPAGPGYAFLGKAGDKVYLLPQSQQSGIVWPGWNTQHESLVKGTRGTVNWRLKQVSGPGKFKLFLTGSFGTPEVIFDSDKSLPQRLGIAPNTHAHGNWAFTRAGIYRLTFDMTASTSAGKSVSDTRTLTLAVGDSTDAGAGNGNGNGTDSAAGNGSAGQNGGGGLLARTGANITTIAAGGALLLAAGTAAVLLTRRRRGEARHVSTPDPSS